MDDRHPELDRLPGLLAGQDVVFAVDREPPEHVRRLMETLGVRVVVTHRNGGTKRMSTSIQSATATIDCRWPGCTNEAKSDRGIYAYLCETHIEEKRRTGVTPAFDRPVNGGGPRPAPVRVRDVSGDGFEAKVKELAKLGREADRAREKAKDATEKALAAKRRADLLEQAFRVRTRELMGDA